MAKKPKISSVPFPENRPKNTTVILDQVGTGNGMVKTWGWNNSDDGLYCSGNIVEHELENESSFMHTWRERYKD